MKSHIQIPKCVFKEFTHYNNSFYKLNVKTGNINKGYPKSTFTQEGYYSEAMEKMLSASVETPLSKLLDFARQLPSQPSPTTLNNQIKEIAFVYMKSLIARSPTLFESAKNSSIFLQFMDIQSQHDVIVDYAMRDKKNDELFEKFDISFMINETLIPFVLPTRGLYEYQINGVMCMNSPLNSKCSVLLKEKGKVIHQENAGQNEISIIPAGFDDVTNKINSFAVTRQFQDSIGYVVCESKEMLKSLKESCCNEIL